MNRMTVKNLMEILKNYKETDEVELIAWTDGGFGCAEFYVGCDVVMTDDN